MTSNERVEQLKSAKSLLLDVGIFPMNIMTAVDIIIKVLNDMNNPLAFMEQEQEKGESE